MWDVIIPYDISYLYISKTHFHTSLLDFVFCMAIFAKLFFIIYPLIHRKTNIINKIEIGIILSWTKL